VSSSTFSKSPSTTLKHGTGGPWPMVEKGAQTFGHGEDPLSYGHETPVPALHLPGLQPLHVQDGLGGARRRGRWSAHYAVGAEPDIRIGPGPSC
jgi:hypothetical protein